MARSGLYKSDIKRARDALIAQGKHPSLDAVRIELGNTGSKTTIHKYLKELEEEEGGVGGRKASISESLQDLVERMAAQLQDEAADKIRDVESQASEKERLHAEALAATHQQITVLKDDLLRLEERLRQETAAHDQTREALRMESIARHMADQQVIDLKERLQENEKHHRSLEEKHQHAREALEHYRNSVKEQREQDARRHDQQVQQLQAEIRTLQQSLVVKQEDVTRLNQEGTKLVADLSHVKQALYDRDAQLRQIQQKLETAQAFEERCRLLESQVAEKDAQANGLTTRLEDSAKDVQRLQIEAATATAKLQAQQTITAELRAFLEKNQAGTAATGSAAAPA